MRITAENKGKHEDTKLSFTFRVLTDGWKKNKKQERKQKNVLDLGSSVFFWELCTYARGHNIKCVS